MEASLQCYSQQPAGWRLPQSLATLIYAWNNMTSLLYGGKARKSRETVWAKSTIFCHLISEVDISPILLYLFIRSMSLGAACTQGERTRQGVHSRRQGPLRMNGEIALHNYLNKFPFLPGLVHPESEGHCYRESECGWVQSHPLVSKRSRTRIEVS